MLSVVRAAARVIRPVGAVVARSLDMGKVIGSNPILGTIFGVAQKKNPPSGGFFFYGKNLQEDVTKRQ
jgi:hypothetical protein